METPTPQPGKRSASEASASSTVGSDVVVDTCRSLGFALAGVAPVRTTDRELELRRWLADGKHADMAWLEKHVDVRVDPGRLLDGARSLILVADQYSPRGHEDQRQARLGRIARYARGRDYHDVIKKRLHQLADALRRTHPDDDFRTFVDTAPVLEREHGVRAGLGWIGKHTLLINPEQGSYLLLGGIATTLSIEPTLAFADDHCGTCTRCIDACPTDAIEPYSVDASKCIAYLTIEHRRGIDASYFDPIGNWLFGCDICQEVCPHNSARPDRPSATHDAYAERRSGFDLLEVLGWDEGARRRAFETSALKRANLEMMKRNALIVAGNRLATTSDAALEDRIGEIAADSKESDLVRQTARHVLARLDGK